MFGKVLISFFFLITPAPAHKLRELNNSALTANGYWKFHLRGKYIVSFSLPPSPLRLRRLKNNSGEKFPYSRRASERRAVWGRISQSIIQMGWDLLGNLLLTFAEYVKVPSPPNSAEISFSERLESISSANMLAVEFINLFWLLWFFFCVGRAGNAKSILQKLLNVVIQMILTSSFSLPNRQPCSSTARKLHARTSLYGHPN